MSKHQITMILWFICGFLILGAGATNFCDSTASGYPSSVCYKRSCTDAIKNHIHKEFHAAFQYLHMGALFGQYTKERPGMAKFFLESATEERGHAIQMMDYLNMRGISFTSEHPSNTGYASEVDVVHNTNEIDLWNSSSITIKSALEEAMRMEKSVTNEIYKVVTHCTDDYHAADVFTNPILEEQHTGMRKLQGAIQTLREINRSLGSDGFAEYYFDQKMLKGEI